MGNEIDSLDWSPENLESAWGGRGESGLKETYTDIIDLHPHSGLIDSTGSDIIPCLQGCDDARTLSHESSMNDEDSLPSLFWPDLHLSLRPNAAQKNVALWGINGTSHDSHRTVQRQLPAGPSAQLKIRKSSRLAYRCPRACSLGLLRVSREDPKGGSSVSPSGPVT